MGIVTNEQDERRPSQFIKLEDKSKLTILSNLYKTKTHFLKSKNRSVACKGDDCVFCKAGVQLRMEYFYYGIVDKEEGIVRVPASVFYAINDQERVLEIDKRDSVWIVSKKGSGLKTEYGVARGKEAGAPTISIEEANAKLAKVCDVYVKNLDQRYLENATEDIPTDQGDEIDVPNEL